MYKKYTQLDKNPQKKYFRHILFNRFFFYFKNMSKILDNGRDTFPTSIIKQEYNGHLTGLLCALHLNRKMQK